MENVNKWHIVHSHINPRDNFDDLQVINSKRQVGSVRGAQVYLICIVIII